MTRDSSGELLPKASVVPPVYVTRLSTTAVLCLTLVISCPTLAWTQSRFESWTTENGLPQNSIRDILQTRDGYLWLATEEGSCDSTAQDSSCSTGVSRDSGASESAPCADSLAGWRSTPTLRGQARSA